MAVKLGDICDLMTGGTPSRSHPEYFKDGNIKWLVSGDIHKGEIYDCNGRITEAGLKNSNARILPVNSVMIALNGQGKTRATVAMLRTEATCNQSLVSIYPKDDSKVLPDWIYWNLKGRYEEMRRITGDSGNDRRGLNMIIIRNIDLPTPPSLEEQRQVVAVLSAAFEKIDRSIELVERNIKNTAMLHKSKRRKTFEEFAGNNVQTLNNIGVNLDSKRIPITKNKRMQGKYPYYGASGIVDYVDNYIFDKDLLLISEDGANLLARSTPIAFVATGKYWVNNHAHIYEFPETKTMRYVEYYFENIDLAPYVTGAAQPKLSQSSLLKIPIAIPDLETQSKVVKIISNSHVVSKNLIASYKTKIEYLNELKKSMLSQSFSQSAVK